MSQPIRLLNSTNATIGWILEMVNCMLNETIAPIIIQSSMPLVPTREAYDVVGSIDIQGTGGREVITVSGPAMLRRLEKNDTDGDSRNDTQLELMGLFLYGTSKQFGKVTLRNDFLKKTIGVIQAERRSRPEYPSQSLIRLNSVLDIPTSTGQLTSLNSSKPQFLVQQLVTTPFTACYNLQNITSSITNPPILFQSPNATVNVTMRGMTLCFNSGTAANMGLDLLLPGGARERVTLFGSIGLTQSDSGGQTINGTITSMRLRGRSASLGDIEAKLIGRATIGQINHIQREGQLFRSGNSYFDLFFQLITDNGTYNNGNLAPLRVEAQTFTVPNRECLQNRTLQTSPYNMSGAVIFDASLCPNFEGDLPKVQENFPPVGKDPIQVGLMMFLTTGNQNHMMTSSGRLLVQRGEPVTIVNQKTIFTEILDMFLEGFTTLLGNFTGNNITITNYTNISANINISGNITGSAAMPFPATSFFDMFFLIRADSVQLCNRVPARIQAVIFNIPSTICFNLINITDSRQPADPVELFVYNDTTKNCTSTQPVINGTAQQVLIRQIMMCPKFALGNRFVRGGFQQKIVIGEETQNSFSSEDVTRYTGVKPIEIRNNGSDLALVRFPFDFDRDDIDISQVEVNVTSIAGRPATYIARNIPLQSGRTKTIVLPVSIQSNKICIIDRSNVTQQEVENCTAGVNISNSTILDCPGQVNNPNDATVAIVCTINGSNYEISGVFNTGAGEVTPTSTAPGPTTVTQPSTFVLAPTAGRSGGGGLPKGSKTVCTDKCKAGEKTCEGTDGYKTCEVLNQCMDWSVKKKCQDGTKCEKGECVKPTPTTTAPVEIPKIEPPKIETPQTEKAIPIEREIPPEPKSDIAATIVFVLGLIISAALIWYAHRK
jgi:hypothetical protein